MQEKNEITIKDIVKEAKRKNRNIDKGMIEKAYHYADIKHKEQVRKSGEPYIIHPLHVAHTVAELGLDTSTICAALLHDVVEDTEASYEDIEKEFNIEIAKIVEGVTKLKQSFQSAEEKQAENYKKMFIAMEEDIRVILLKLADRLHNISTLQYLKRDRQIAISKETIEFYAPIAHKLGMYQMKMDLQDGAFEYLYPKEYKKITKDLEKLKEKNEKYLNATKEKIEKQIKKEKINATLTLEMKHIYNIYKKMTEKNIEINQIKDLFSLKIITKNKQDCYKALGAINSVYNMIPKTFKDYIATPRNNMYQAIHEIIIGEKGVIIETQICSYEMDMVSKYGITNYFMNVNNKKNKTEVETHFEEKLSGIHDTLELKQIIEDPVEFLNTLKTELFNDEIYVFTPKGDVIALPKGATGIDFAFHIKKDLGKHMKNCRINSIDMPLVTKLQSGNIVEIVTSKEECIPKKEWLEYLATAKAKSQIIKMLKENKVQEKTAYRVKIEAENRENITLDITIVFTKIRLNILVFNTSIENDTAKIDLVMETRKIEKLEKLKNKLAEISEIKSVSIHEDKDYNIQE